jgi:hypothetical protein
LPDIIADLEGISAVKRSIAAFMLAAAFCLPVRADNEPLLWPDGTITYRDWGLYRPGVPVLIERPYFGYGYDYGAGRRPVTKSEAVPYLPTSNGEQFTYPANSDFYPSNHGDPNANRMRPRIRPVPPQPYSRYWGVGSDPDPAPASEPAEQTSVPVDPTVIYEPDEHHRRKGGHNDKKK